MNPVAIASLKAVVLTGVVTPFLAFIAEMALLGFDPLDGGFAMIALPLATLVTLFVLFVIAFPLTIIVDDGNPARGQVALLSCLALGSVIALLLLSQTGVASRILALHAVFGTMVYCSSYWMLQTRAEQND